MEGDILEQMRYPIGKFKAPEKIDSKLINDWIDQLDNFPARLRQLVSNLDDDTLNTPYRPGGWTIGQMVHHVADSHLHSYIRFKWTLTENEPVIKPYNEKAWAELFDYRSAPIALSLEHLALTHKRLVYLVRGLSSEQLKRQFIHPDGSIYMTLEQTLGHYAWHGEHHYNHIAVALKNL